MDTIKKVVEGYNQYYNNDSLNDRISALQEIIDALSTISGKDRRIFAGQFIGAFAHFYDSKTINELVKIFRLKVKQGYRFEPEE